MKIGFSYGKCVRDIVNGLVSVDDVVYIIAGTAVRSEDEVRGVVNHYLRRPGYLENLDAEKCTEVALQLWNAEKILQPRLQSNGAWPNTNFGVWVDIFPTALNNNQSVKNAWETYRCMLHMSSCDD